MSEFPGLEYCWPPTTDAVTWVRSISISFWKSKTPFEKSSAINSWNQRLAENQNVTLKQKSIFLFSQRQNIKLNENNTRIKTSEFYKWYSSNTVDIKLSRRYLYISENIVNPSLACEQALCLGKGWKNREEREGKWGKPVEKHLRPPFHGSRCAPDPDASSYWLEQWLLTGLIYFAFFVARDLHKRL